MSNVVQLNRKIERPISNELGFYIRVGHNDHKGLLELLASGERGMFGFVISAQHTERHSELITDARDRGFDVILDPKTQEMATPGGYSSSFEGLPWGGDRFHLAKDFQNHSGRVLVESIVEFAVENRFTQLLGPTHLLNNPNDTWLRTDVRAMGWAKDAIAAAGANLQLIYSLAIPIAVLRDRGMRQALLPAIADIPCDAIWLKIENFGDDASGEKTVAFLEACRDFHDAGIPIVADFVGGLPGLATLAFGAVGGIAHGVAINQNFKASRWRKAPTAGQSNFAPPKKRVYIPQLDAMLDPDMAKSLLQSSPRARGQFSCNDQHCCAHGVQDMLARPARHALYQRAREIERIAATPQALRAETFMDRTVRPISDDVARVAGFASLDGDVRQKFSKKQSQVSSFRAALTHFLEAPSPSVAVAPQRRSVNN